MLFEKYIGTGRINVKKKKNLQSFNRWLPYSDNRLNREALAAQITECREAVQQGVDVKEELEKLIEAMAKLEAQFTTFKTGAWQISSIRFLGWLHHHGQDASQAHQDRKKQVTGISI